MDLVVSISEYMQYPFEVGAGLLCRVYVSCRPWAITCLSIRVLIPREWLNHTMQISSMEALRELFGRG